jgi:tetratricopeptide repeat protein 30
MSLAQLHWAAGETARAQDVLQQSAEFCSDHPTWRLNLAHALVAQNGGRMGEAAELYESLVQHFAGGGGGGDVSGGAAGAPGSLLDVPPTALANLCVCHVVGGQNEAAEELLRRLEDESGVAAATGEPPGPHLALTNLAIGTLYCAKGMLSDLEGLGKHDHCLVVCLVVCK